MTWYKTHAREHLEVLAATHARRLGVKHQSVQIYEMKKRWGSGGSNGRLRFNWRIIMAPRRLVEYVVAHEVCHLVHADHSPAFFRKTGTKMMLQKLVRKP